MTPKQLATFLKSAKLSQSEAARQLGIDPRTVRRYVAGDAPVPRVVEYALRYIVSKGGQP